MGLRKFGTPEPVQPVKFQAPDPQGIHITASDDEWTDRDAEELTRENKEVDE